MPNLSSEWIDGLREPLCEPDPSFPLGKDLDASDGCVATCSIDLPYPAARCGYHLVSCAHCGYRVAVTTAGRVDDPRSLKLGCYGQKSEVP